MKSKIEAHKSTLRSVIDLLSKPMKVSYPLNDEGFSNIWLLGAGKASISMAQKIIDRKGVSAQDGIIITNEKIPSLKSVQIFKGAHPYPDENSVSASYELITLARKIPAEETVVFCLSGGASSLLCIPPKGIEIEELAYTYELLLNSGAPINKLNIVRKHLCSLKGGQLAQALHHTNLITVISSDVPNDDLETIGSAPTICDSSTFKDAFQVLKKYGLWNEVPHSIRIHIVKGMSGDIPDTPKPGVNDHPNHKVKIVSKAVSLANQIGLILKEEGYNTLIADTAYDGDVRKVSKTICSKAISVLSNNDILKKPAALIYYGESTVEVKGSGKGGRNQELALISAISIEGQHSISMLSIGTDGIDGPTDVAGAIVTSETTLLARKKKLNPEEYLQNNDSYHFHKEMSTSVRIGPTGKNLMDLQVVIIE
ncbi:MAG: glycerate kinase [Balneolaceae bacterium]